MVNRKAYLGRLFKEIEHKLKHMMRRCFEDNGITMPQGMVIGILHKHGEMKISELSSKMGLSNSTVSGIIDRLEKQGSVERVRSLEDKRIVYVKLSSKFADMHQSVNKGMEEQFERLVEKGTPEEIEKVIEGLNVLKKIIDKSELEK